MARPRSAMPAYRYHISGQAVVTLAGKDFYLGPADSPESRGRYFALLTEYNRNGMKAPEASTHQAGDQITVRCVTGAYREHIETKYANNRTERYRGKDLCGTLEEMFGDTPAAEFGPVRLAQVRELFVAAGNCRRYVNTQTRGIVRIFKHAISRELIKAEVLVGLETLEPLRAGQTVARETKSVEPVDIEAVRRTAEHLSPVLKAMVRVQVATGMRPSEVCRMRPADIDQSGTEWIYRPATHKTQHHGKAKAVPILGDARLALTPFMDRPEFCFSPRESAEWYRAQRTASRVVPLSCGQRVGTNRKENPKRRPGEFYNKDSYRHAIQRAANKAKVAKWFPYQLRHLAATVVRDALDAEFSQALLGHSRIDMTQRYAKVSEAKAIEAAKHAPKI